MMLVTDEIREEVVQLVHQENWFEIVALLQDRLKKRAEREERKNRDVLFGIGSAEIYSEMTDQFVHKCRMRGFSQCNSDLAIAATVGSYFFYSQKSAMRNLKSKKKFYFFDTVEFAEHSKSCKETELQQARIERLWECLSQLSDQERKIIDLFLWSGNRASVGRQLGISRAYVGRVVQEAIPTLRECIEEEV